MTNIATISDYELRDMRDRFAEIKRGPLDPANERDRHALFAFLPMMVELLDEVLRLRGVAEAHGNALQRAATAAGLLAGDDMHTMLAPAIERLRAHAEAEPEWAAIDAAIREYVDDYELIGEDETGADACYTPTQSERVLIRDAINGLLADEKCMRLIATRRAPFDLIAHIERARAFSERTFGPGARTAGVIAHIRKELAEIEAAPDDLSEWIDVVILALDGAWRAGYSAEQIVEALAGKQSKNEARKWPDWRTAPADGPIEHVREGESMPEVKR